MQKKKETQRHNTQSILLVLLVGASLGVSLVMNHSLDNYVFHLVMEENKGRVMFAHAPSHYSFIFCSVFFFSSGRLEMFKVEKAGQTRDRHFCHF